MDEYIFNEDNDLMYELADNYYLLCPTVPAEENSLSVCWANGTSGISKSTIPHYIMLCC